MNLLFVAFCPFIAFDDLLCLNGTPESSRYGRLLQYHSRGRPSTSIEVCASDGAGQGLVLGGMIISRRPKRRASNENAPGPRNTIAAAMIATRTAVNFWSNKFGVGAVKIENPTPMAPRLPTMPAMGVRAPISNAAPAKSPTKPPSHVPGVDVALPAR